MSVLLCSLLSDRLKSRQTSASIWSKWSQTLDIEKKHEEFK